MPYVAGKSYPYTEAGMRAARAAMKEGGSVSSKGKKSKSKSKGYKSGCDGKATRGRTRAKVY
jgi:hypothetical protein